MVLFSDSVMGGGLDQLVDGFIDSTHKHYANFYKPYQTPADFLGHALVTPISAPVVAASSAVIAVCLLMKGGYDAAQGKACHEDFSAAGTLTLIALGEAVLTAASPILWPGSLVTRLVATTYNEISTDFAHRGNI
ncbi:MAG: hypothetical protein EPN84_01090 [Legionella sp.]|nr:MAG: hypothetical protein EPN84_01090 [Legionella sp.]